MPELVTLIPVTTPLLFTLGLNRLAQAAVIVPRAMAAGMPFAPEKDGKVFMADAFNRGRGSQPWAGPSADRRFTHEGRVDLAEYQHPDYRYPNDQDQSGRQGYRPEYDRGPVDRDEQRDYRDREDRRQAGQGDGHDKYAATFDPWDRS